MKQKDYSEIRKLYDYKYIHSYDLYCKNRCRVTCRYNSNTDHIAIFTRITKVRGNTNLQLLNKLKSNGCAICGYSKSLRALHFHHSNPKDKKFQINKNTLNKQETLEELSKCVLLCCNCHMEIEDKERRK